LLVLLPLEDNNFMALQFYASSLYIIKSKRCSTLWLNLFFFFPCVFPPLHRVVSYHYLLIFLNIILRRLYFAFHYEFSTCIVVLIQSTTYDYKVENFKNFAFEIYNDDAMSYLLNSTLFFNNLHCFFYQQ